MSIEKQLEDLILLRFGTISTFSHEIGLPNSTVVSILRRGIHKASIDNVIKICKALNISADYLAHDEIAFLPSTANAPVERDIEYMLLSARQNAPDMKNFFLSGFQLTSNEIDTILDAVEIAIGIVKRKRIKEG